MAVGDFNCPKCGAQMEECHMVIVAERGFTLLVKSILYPWQKPLDKLDEKDKETKEILLKSLFGHYESDVRRCTKCKLILLARAPVELPSLSYLHQV